jgi:IPT/TIG domain-containing protein
MMWASMVSSVSGRDRARRCACAALLCAAGAVIGCSSPTSPTAARVTITSIAPSRGGTGGGTTVTISGSGFAEGATVAIGGAPAANVKVVSPTSITASTPARTAAGSSAVTVTVGASTASLAGGFTYVAPSGTNQPPVIASIRSVGSRPRQPAGFADIGETITLVAVVSDNETAASALTYQWSGPGTFSGTGSSVSWTAPATVASRPSPVSISLTVIEDYTEADVAQRNTASASYVVSVHDSQTEILDIGEDFLTLFTHSEIPTDQVLHNFSTTCDRGRGRSDEAGDVNRARQQYVEDFSKFRISRLPPVDIRFGSTFYAFGEVLRPHVADAAAQFQVHWEITYIINVDADRRIGTHEVSDGVDYVTATLENDRWMLCSSDWNGMSVQTGTGIRRVERSFSRH